MIPVAASTFPTAALLGDTRVFGDQASYPPQAKPAPVAAGLVRGLACGAWLVQPPGGSKQSCSRDCLQGTEQGHLGSVRLKNAKGTQNTQCCSCGTRANIGVVAGVIARRQAATGSMETCESSSIENGCFGFEMQSTPACRAHHAWLPILSLWH